ncbi:MAG: hypothetical protein LBP21_03140 [Synergistaceae bacterium]|nr:hypothetical protein [Synergistaceae bacterium]
MKRFHSATLFILFVLGVGAATPAFASLSISVGTIDRFADGADVTVTIYEDDVPVAVDFNFKLDDGENVVIESTGSTDENGEATIVFDSLLTDVDFSGAIWIGDYDDPEAFQTFSFSTSSDLEEKYASCNVAYIELVGLVLLVLSVLLKRK